MAETTAQLKEADLLAVLGPAAEANPSGPGAAAAPPSANGGSPPPDALVSSEDFAAAVAEIEGSGPAGNGTGPTAGEGDAGVDALRAQAHLAATPEPQGKTVALPTATPETSGTTPASTVHEPDQPAVKSAQPVGEPPNALKFTIGRKGSGTVPKVAPAPPAALDSAPVAVAIAEFADAAPDEALEPPKLGLAVRIGKRTIRLLEAGLDTIHRPIARFSPGLLRAIGVCALTTIGVSAFSIVALPVLFPARDAISYLNERVAALDAPKVEPKAGDEAHSGEKAKEAPHGDSHGAEKPKTKAGESKPKPAGDAHAAKKDAVKKPAGAHH